LIDQHVEALRELRGGAGYYPDSKLPGLFIYVGPRKVTWKYRERRSDWPAVNTAERRGSVAPSPWG